MEKRYPEFMNRVKAMEKQLATYKEVVNELRDGIKWATFYMSESGYPTIESSEPEYQMWKDLSEAEKKAAELLKEIENGTTTK